MHLGGLRTALYNYLLAKHPDNTGQFVLRVEDTDRTRLVPGAVNQLLETLSWAGLSADEGPSTPGPHGPYTQSERTPLYLKHVNTLIAEDKAYPCFCSSSRLEKLRASQERRGVVTQYDRACSTIPKDQAKERMARIDAARGGVGVGVDGVDGVVSGDGVGGSDTASEESYVVRMRVPYSGETVVQDVVRGTVR